MGGYLSSSGTPDIAGNAAIDRVLIPVDQSSHAETAFDWYLRHVHKPANKLTVIHCVVQPIPTNYVSEHSYSPDDLKKEIQEAVEEGQRVVRKYEQKMTDAGISGSVLTEYGQPGEVVVNAVPKNDISLIVMGSRGFGVVRRTVLGSVSRYVIGHSGVPVCVLPKEKGRWF